MDWKNSFNIQVENLGNVTESKRSDKEIKEFIRICKKAKGFHYFTGVGKNGFVAAMASATFNSLGIRSMFVDPVNSLHGDMNIFTTKDIVICISKSGETAELLSFISALKKRSPGTLTVAITSNAHTSLSRMSSHCVVLPIAKEADHLNTAPLSATLTYTAVLQAVATELSSSKGFTKADFIKGHPGGSLGKIAI